MLQTPQNAVDHQPCVGGPCHLDPVSFDLQPKVKNRTQKGAVAPLAAVCFERGVETQVLMPLARILG